MISKALQEPKRQQSTRSAKAAFLQWSLQYNETEALWALTYSSQASVGTALKQLMRKWLNMVSSLQCRRTASFGWVWMSVKPNHHAGSIIYISSVWDAIIISLLDQKAQNTIERNHNMKSERYWSQSHDLTTRKRQQADDNNLKLSGTSNSKDLAQIMWWNTFLNRNYEALSMWLDYKLTIVMPHSEMNSSVICTFSSNMETTSLLLESLCYIISILTAIPC